MRVAVHGISPRYLMAELAMIDSSRLEVPPKLFTTSATFIPGKSPFIIDWFHTHP